MDKSSIDLNTLHTKMRIKYREVVRLCAAEEVELHDFDAYRSPHDQARAYRRSRTRAEIVAKQAQLEQRGYKVLSQIIDQAGPQYGLLGEHVTNAAPGESFHQFREAKDAVPLLDRKVLAWSVQRGLPEYAEAQRLWAIYGACVREAGLFWGGDWKGFKDLPHCQYREASNPLSIYTPEQVQQIADKEGWLS